MKKRNRASFRELALFVTAPALLVFGTMQITVGARPWVARRTPQQDRSRPMPPRDDEPPPPKVQKPSPTPTPQTPAESGDDEVVRVSSNLVVVPVSVTDKDGNPVLHLKQTDFQLDEAGKRQEIAQLGAPDQVPLDIALLFDLSSSTSGRFTFQQDAASRFLKEVVRPGDTATVFAIDKQPELVQERGTVDKAINTLMGFRAATVATPTAFYDTVTAAADYLARTAPKDHRRVILVISDGDDTFSRSISGAALAEYNLQKGISDNSSTITPAVQRRNLDELHRRAQADVQRVVQRADTVFYSINPSGESISLNVISTRAQNGMQGIADATGGAAFVPNTDQDLEKVFRQIASELHAQYLLQYYSNDESPVGKFIPIKVSLVAPTAQSHVRARQGYYQKKH